MIRAVIFDMYETLVTMTRSVPYKGTNIAKDLGLKAEECLYVGDGGSRELETAQAVGMKAAQATWYLCEGFGQLVGRKPEFEQLEKPEDVLGQV
ncbi:MAG: HAD family hydrolase [Treponema sp.]|nr:HAD family hydrolase [Treponema sp.]